MLKDRKIHTDSHHLFLKKFCYLFLPFLVRGKRKEFTGPKSVLSGATADGSVHDTIFLVQGISDNPSLLSVC